jgi:hypothetical protein
MEEKRGMTWRRLEDFHNGWLTGQVFDLPDSCRGQDSIRDEDSDFAGRQIRNRVFLRTWMLCVCVCVYVCVCVCVFSAFKSALNLHRA